MTNVITRFPPSPTGFLHVGSARTALFNYLYAKKNGGKIILRWEDTDRARSKKEFEQEMFEGFEWLQLKFDEIYHQSERGLVYKKHIEKMIADGTAYLSEESKTSSLNDMGEDEETVSTDGSLNRVVRFKNPNKLITFDDSVRGEISVDTTELGDFIIARNVEEPLYHLAVVIDDFEMGITHIIRGEDGIYNTPRQILLQEAIGAPRPVYCHLPFVLGSDKSKLSKRHGATSVTEYKNLGILPEALLNYLALLGWNPGTEQEIFTIKELVEVFDLKQIQKSGAVFNMEKLLWINREHLKKMSDTDFKKQVSVFLTENIFKMKEWSDERLSKLLPELRERISTFLDVKNLCENGELDFAFETPEYESEKLLPPRKKGQRIIKEETIASHLTHVKNLLEAIDEKNFDKDTIKNSIFPYADEEGRPVVLWPLRYALSGKERSPDPFTIGAIIGKAETLKRIETAISKINKVEPSQENK